MSCIQSAKLTMPAATKCDDISCSEVIRALQLRKDSNLVRVEKEIQEAKEQFNEWKERKIEAKSNIESASILLNNRAR